MVFWFRFANSCCPLRPPRLSLLRQFTRIPEARRLRSGPAHYAAALCSSSSELARLRLSSVLRRKPASPEMLKSIHCRPSNASVSDCGFCAFAIAILSTSRLPPAYPESFKTFLAPLDCPATTGKPPRSQRTTLGDSMKPSGLRPASIQSP